MTKVIILSGGSLDSFYEQTLQFVHDKYHTYIGEIGVPVSEEEVSEISYNDAMARYAASGAGDANIPLGKLVA